MCEELYMNRQQQAKIPCTFRRPDPWLCTAESQHEIVVARLQCLLRVKTQGPPCILDVILKMAKDYVDHRWARGGAKGVLPPLEKKFMTPPSI